MPLVEQAEIMPLTAALLHSYHTKLSKEDRRKGAEALAILFDTEEYGMHPDRFFGEEPEHKRPLAALKDDFLSEVSLLPTRLGCC